VDGLTVFALATVVLVGVAGFVFAFAAIRLTRKQERGRGAVVLFALCLPALYVAYLLTAGHFRNEYHRFHSKAYESEGFNNLVLGHDYQLWFFDETPWMSSIAKGLYKKSQITNIQRLSIEGTRVLGQTGTTSMFDGPTDYFFCLDLSSGALQKFRTESELRSATTTFAHLRRPEEVYNAELANEHSSVFWPLICFAPVALSTGIWSVIRRSAELELKGDVSKSPSSARITG
jgi:hypothetical protein